jgi:hypothetical protein
VLEASSNVQPQPQLPNRRQAEAPPFLLAILAVTAENDELALEALQRKREHDHLHRLFAREHEYGVRIVGLLREMFDAVEAGARSPP